MPQSCAYWCHLAQRKLTWQSLWSTLAQSSTESTSAQAHPQLIRLGRASMPTSYKTSVPSHWARGLSRFVRVSLPFRLSVVIRTHQRWSFENSCSPHEGHTYARSFSARTEVDGKQAAGSHAQGGLPHTLVASVQPTMRGSCCSHSFTDHP